MKAYVCAERRADQAAEEYQSLFGSLMDDRSDDCDAGSGGEEGAPGAREDKAPGDKGGEALV